MYMCGTTIKSAALSDTPGNPIFPTEKQGLSIIAMNNILFVDFLMYLDDESHFYDAYCQSIKKMNN